MGSRAWLGVVTISVGLCSVGAAWIGVRPAVAQPAGTAGRTFRLTAKRYAFTPNRLEVSEGELVRIEIHTEDIAHSLTIDQYRIAKRVDAGHPAILEFRADQAGTFPIYCNLQNDDGCRKMRGELVVRARR